VGKPEPIEKYPAGILASAHSLDSRPPLYRTGKPDAGAIKLLSSHLLEYLERQTSP